MILLTWGIYIIAEALVQGHMFKTEENFRPDYRILWLFRIGASILHGILIQTNDYYYYNFLDYACAVGFQMCSFWIFFDLSLNYLREKPWYYDGGEDSSEFDQMPNVKYWILKSFAFLGIFLFYFLYQHIVNES